MSEKLHRAGWLFMVVLFLLTSVGIGAYAFWQNTHPSDTPTKSTAIAACQFDSVPAEVLAAPAFAKPEGAITKLKSTDITKGTGAGAQAGDCVTAKYYGTLTDGTKFDEDYTTPLAIKFPLGVGQVIPGWDEGLIGMQVGGIRRLEIPASLAYGAAAVGNIPANSDLIFEVKLEAIK